MIDVNFKGNTIAVNGHAGYDVIGKDIVCAGISTLFFTYAASTDAEIRVVEGKTKKAIAKDTPKNKAICEAVFKGCKLIEAAYPGYVSVRRTLPKDGV